MSIRWPRLLNPTQLSQLIRCQKNPLKALRIFNEAKTRYPSYNHNGPVYGTMIRILGDSGRITEMKEIVNQMKEDSCECKDSVFACIIKTYANAGLFEESMSLFKSLPQFNCVSYTISFNTLLEIMLRENKLESHYEFFVNNCRGWEIKSRMRALNLLMDSLCQMQRSDLALHIFQEMEYQWCYPDRETYKILMKGLCDDGRLTEATHLLYSMFWKISQKGCGADVSVYRMLLESLCDNGEVEEAAEILEKVLRKGLRAPRKFRKPLDLTPIYYKDKEGINHVKSLMNEALIKGEIASQYGYGAIAIDFFSEGRILEGDKVLTQMYEKAFWPSLAVYEAKVKALLRTQHLDEAVDLVEREMIEKNCVPSLRLHNLIIKELCKARKCDWAVKHFEKMLRQVGSAPNKETYTYLVDGLCNNGEYMEASRMLEKMLMSKFWPGGEVFEKLIHGLCSIGKTYKAVMWLEEMIDEAKIPESCVWASLVVSCVCSENQNVEMMMSEIVDG